MQALNKLKPLHPICHEASFARYETVLQQREDLEGGTQMLQRKIAAVSESQQAALAQCDVEQAKQMAAEVSFTACMLKGLDIASLQTLKKLREQPKRTEQLLTSTQREFKAVQAGLGSCAAPGSVKRLQQVEQQVAELQSVAPGCTSKAPSSQEIASLKTKIAQMPQGASSPALQRQLATTRRDVNHLAARAKDKWLNPTEVKAEVVRLRRTTRQIEQRAGNCDPKVRAQTKQIIAKIDSIPIAGVRGNVASRQAPPPEKKKENFFDKLFGGSDDSADARGRME